MSIADDWPTNRRVEPLRELVPRVERVLRSVPIERRHLGEALPSEFQHGRTPTWLLLPTWLNEAWTHEGAVLPRDTVTDLLWGQYALFLYIRIHDDLMDQQRHDLRLLFVADRFLIESLQAFQGCASLDSEFWTFYRDCLRDTVDGILEVRRLEAEPGRFAAEHLELHARVSAIFKVGVAALCHLRRRTAETAWLSGFMDHVAVLNQICDDVQDLAGDLQDRRFTWVANVLLDARPGDATLANGISGRLVDALMRGERGVVFLSELRRLARAAAETVPPSASARVREFATSLRFRPDALEQRMHEARVRWVFEEVLGER
jgi:hypothetical protein